MKFRAFLLVLTAFIVTSCNCSYHIKKVKAKCGYSSDTVYRVDTMFTKEVSTDTIFKYYTKDTVVIKEGKLKVKYFYNTHDSTVFLQGKCDADTVYKKVPFIVNNYKANWFEENSWLVKLILFAIVIFLLFKFARRV
jgi:hypothetical protein